MKRGGRRRTQADLIEPHSRSPRDAKDDDYLEFLQSFLMLDFDSRVSKKGQIPLDEKIQSGPLYKNNKTMIFVFVDCLVITLMKYWNFVSFLLFVTGPEVSGSSSDPSCDGMVVIVRHTKANPDSIRGQRREMRPNN